MKKVVKVFGIIALIGFSVTSCATDGNGGGEEDGIAELAAAIPGSTVNGNTVIAAEDVTIAAGTTVTIPAGVTLVVDLEATLTVADGAALTLESGAVIKLTNRDSRINVGETETKNFRLESMGGGEYAGYGTFTADGGTVSFMGLANGSKIKGSTAAAALVLASEKTGGNSGIVGGLTLDNVTIDLTGTNGGAFNANIGETLTFANAKIKTKTGDFSTPLVTADGYTVTGTFSSEDEGKTLVGGNGCSLTGSTIKDADGFCINQSGIYKGEWG